MEDTNQDAIDIEMDNNDNAIDYNSSDIEEYDEVIELDENTLQRLKKNDSSVTHLSLSLSASDQNYHNYFNDIDWKVDGDCIASNTHLKKLHIIGSIPADHKHNRRQLLEDFFSCMNRNRSINVIDINSACFEFGGDLIEGLQGHPSINRLDVSVSYSKKLGSKGYSVLGKVLQHTRCKLNDLRLTNCKLDDEGISIVCDALLGNSTLKKLDLSDNGQISPIGWTALSAFLQSTKCNLIELKLFRTGINDEGADILGNALHVSSVKVLHLSCYHENIGSVGWQTLLNQSALKSLDISCNSSITPEGWESLFNSLQRRGTKLVELNIAENNIGYEGLDALGKLISNMNTLKILCMNDMVYTDDEAWVWVSFFDTMWGSNLDLVELYLGDIKICDDGIEVLTSLVSSMPSLKILTLGYNRSVTPFGWWQALSEILESPNFVLKELHLDQNKIDDDTMIVFANALEHNKTLKSLHLYQDPRDFDDDDNLITKKGWEAVSTLLCNKTSIMDTYNSNHTLQDFTDDPILYDDEIKKNLPSDLISSIELNKNKDKVEVARQKILQTHFHFSDDDTSNMQEFLDMELQVMPTVVEWIGRPTPIGWRGSSMTGLSMMYKLVRKMPDLFDSNAQKKLSAGKRKRDV